ncbi:MAG: putative toxin-antitoxin system toxin component, PIN family [Lysobacterales bacterium]|jgi:putative PIN family toxin of toxin-antitoxin system
MRLVLDTNVVASALLWGGMPRLLLQSRREQRVMLFTSTPLLAELTDILGRRKFEKKIAASLMSVDQLVDRYSDLTIMVRPIAVTGVAPDPDDDVVIGTALAARAELIVTGDKGLLSVNAHLGVRVVGVGEAVAAIEKVRK